MSSVRLLMAVHTRWQYHHVVHTCNKTAQQNPFSLSTAKDAPNPNESARTIIRLPCIFLLNLTCYEVKTLKAYLKCHLEIKDQKTESTLLAPASFKSSHQGSLLVSAWIREQTIAGPRSTTVHSWRAFTHL